MPLVNYLINGVTQAHIDIEDRALHYGDGVFETMLYRQGKVALWPQHLCRLRRGCAVLGLGICSDAQLLSDFKVLTKDLKNEYYIIKLIVSRGAAGRGLSVDKNKAVSRVFLAYDVCVDAINTTLPNKLKVCETRLLMNRTLGGIKHLNRLLYVLAAEELDHNVSEGIMLNDRNEMIECIMHNLFFVKNNILYTAPINDCGVAGIKRQQVLDKAQQLGISIKMKAVALKDLKQMDECFITNAVVGLQAVESIDNVSFTQTTMMHQLQTGLSEAH